MSDEVAKKRKRGRWRWLLLLLLILLLLLLLRGCPGEPFDYFADKADELDHDRAKVIAYVLNDVRRLLYQGDGKGALGALWDGAGSPEAKLALANAILAHCPGAAIAELEEVAPGSSVAGRPYPARRLTLTHRRLLPGGESEDTEIWAGPIGALVGDVHSLIATEGGGTRFVIRSSEGAVDRAMPASGASGEEIVFQVEGPFLDEPIEIVRTLWRSDDRVGPLTARAGDRHDFVVLPCRMTPFVREKEGVVIEQRGREGTAEAAAYDALLEYALRSDELLAFVERDFEVRAMFDLPRILVLSRTGPAGEPSFTLDLALNRAGFEGDREAAFPAAAARSHVEIGLQHEFLELWTGAPTRSFFDLMKNIATAYPSTHANRVEAIHAALRVLEERGGPDGRATFGEFGGPVKALEVVRRDGSFALDGKTFGTADEAAPAVEDAVRASLPNPDGGHDYVLETEVDPGREPLVMTAARFLFRWGEGADAVKQWVQVATADGGLAFNYNVRRGFKVARGVREVGEEALETAVRHNPRYHTGKEDQDDATSFCLSRAVFRTLKNGEAASIEVLGGYGIGDDPEGPRPVVWTGTLVPTGSRDHELTINGRTVSVPILEVETRSTSGPAKGIPAKLTVLDDPRWPIGMAGSLVQIHTYVRGRVLDEEGLGIGNAIVQIREGDDPVAAALTWPDGRFRFHPPVFEDSWGKVELTVIQDLAGTPVTEVVEADLTDPGLSEIAVTVPRARLGFVWIGPGEEGRLAELSLSDQLKRHAGQQLAAGRMVAIPDRALPIGPGGVAGLLVFDSATGDATGVLESGVGATSFASWWGPEVDPPAGAHMLDFRAPPPSIGLKSGDEDEWGYSAERVKNLDAAVLRAELREAFELWDTRTEFFRGIRAIDAQDPEKARARVARLLELARARPLRNRESSEAFRTCHRLALWHLTEEDDR